ncbi:hypothetical protein P9112_007407 [Eukaryota sp. TZLM1-RC]
MHPLYKQSKPFPFFGKSDEDDRTLINHLSSRVPSSARKRKPQSSSNSDASLLTSMATRLKAAEHQLSEAQSKIKTLTTENSRLQDELLHSKSDLIETSCPPDCHHKSEARRLAKRVQEMEQFFKDYDLRWVGSSAPVMTAASLNMAKLGAAIEKLNEKVSSALEVAQKGRISQLKSPDAIQLMVFEDGLTLRGGLLRVFGSPGADDVLFDLLESYFPSELKTDFPNGVLIDLIDCTDKTYKSWAEKQSTEVNGPGSQKPLTLERLVNNLPNQVIKDGKIIEVKSAISDKHGQKPHPENVFYNLCSENSKTAVSDFVDVNIKFSSSWTFLDQSKLIDGFLKLKMVSFDTIQVVIDLITQFLPSKSPKFKLFRPIPKQVFDQPNLTLKELGLYPKAILFCSE